MGIVRFIYSITLVSLFFISNSKACENTVMKLNKKSELIKEIKNEIDIINEDIKIIFKEGESHRLDPVHPIALSRTRQSLQDKLRILEEEEIENSNP